MKKDDASQNSPTVRRKAGLAQPLIQFRAKFITRRGFAALTKEAIKDIFVDIRDKVEESNSYRSVNEVMIVLFLVWLLVVSSIVLLPFAV